jgi:sulfur carrier protein
MRVTINGKPEEVSGGTLLEILKAKDVEPRMVAVELNSTMVDREALAHTAVKEGDSLEFLFYMGGGS